MQIKEKIDLGKTSLGIEFGSTRIKAVLIDEQANPIASGSHTWENRLENGIWTYSLDDIHTGLHSCYNELKKDVSEKYGTELVTVGSIGISAMMHGYMPFDDNGNLLSPFRTWRNTVTAQASEELTELFGFNIPQRWSVSHLRQAMLNGEEHLKSLSKLMTLAVYINYRLTGEFAAGVGEASGMFPIDSETNNYDEKMLKKFDALCKNEGYSFSLCDVLPRVLTAGERAGTLTPQGAKFLDESGALKAGIPVCPPEGDAGTGMTATNAVREKTGNVSAGTSIFSMVVLEKALKGVYPEIDMVTTPAGKPVAMVHCNNCTGDIDAWVRLFSEFAELSGNPIDKPKLYDMLYFEALKADKDCGGLVSYNYLSGEPVSNLSEGRPLFARLPDSKFNLANFMRCELYSAFAALKNGNDILLKKEGVTLDKISGHGGLYKTEGVGQRITAAALNTRVSVMKTAGEGGPWGMAILALYMLNKEENETLEDYLDNKIFASAQSSTVEPDEADVKGFEEYMKRYNGSLDAERAAVESLK